MSFRKVFAGLALVLVLSAVILVPSASAADFRNDDRVVIAAGEVINDDLYVTARELVIDGTVNGDVYALAQTITINGTVNYDVNAAAQAITINGTVGSDARLAGQAIILGENAKITRGLLAAGFSLETKPGSGIGNDALFGAYQALLAGNIGKDVIAWANGIEVTGTVGRNVRVTVGQDRSNSFSPNMYMRNLPVSIPTVASGLTIAPSAVIGGDLIYESQQPANVETGSQVTGPVVQQTPVPSARRSAEPVTAAAVQAQQTQSLVDGAFNHLRRFIILLLLGLLAVWLLPKFVSALSSAIRTNPLGSFGRGLLMVVGFIAALFVLAIATIVLALLFGLLTLGDLAGLTVSTGIIVFGVLTFAFSVFTSYVAPIVVSFLIGSAIFNRGQASGTQNRFIAFVVGLILLSLVSLVPILNILIGILVAVIALGALALWVGARRASPAPAVMQPA